MIDEVEAPKTDFYLKLVSKASMPSVLSAFYDDEGELVSNTADYSIDVVGVLHEATGVTLTDASGMDYPEVSPITGWHLNIRLVGDAHRDYVEALAASHGVSVNSPSRFWL